MYYNLLNKKSEILIPTRCLYFKNLQTTYLYILLGPKGFVPTKGPMLLIVPAGLIINWVTDFNTYVDTKATGLRLLYIYSNNIPEGERLDPKKHVSLLISSSEGDATFE